MLTTAIAPGLFADPESESRGANEVAEAAGHGDFYDEPDADYADDGSSTIQLSPADIALETLTPLSPIEESGLLGAWGDSPDEAED